VCFVLLYVCLYVSETERGGGGGVGEGGGRGEAGGGYGEIGVCLSPPIHSDNIPLFLPPPSPLPASLYTDIRRHGGDEGRGWDLADISGFGRWSA
jgi:hypothetical protein